MIDANHLKAVVFGTTTYGLRDKQWWSSPSMQWSYETSSLMRQQAQYLLMHVPIEPISPRSIKHRMKTDQFNRDMLEI
jgi:hypothetical protein